MRGLKWMLAGAVIAVAGCGSPFSEEWEGEEGRCTNGNGGTDTVELRLDGPVTASPSGTWRWNNGGSSWLEADILDATYIGTTLTFATELRVEFLGQTFVTRTEYELDRAPGKLTGTSTTKGSNSTTVCDIDLTPKH